MEVVLPRLLLFLLQILLFFILIFIVFFILHLLLLLRILNNHLIALDLVPLLLLLNLSEELLDLRLVEGTFDGFQSCVFSAGYVR